jgi:hypothetical protein
MKTLLFTILISILFSLTLSAQESEWWEENKVYSFNETAKWDKWDKILMTSYTISTIADCLQTRDIFDNPHKFREKNRVIKYMVDKTGRGSIPVYFIALNYVQYKIADHLKTFYIPVPFTNSSLPIPARKIFLTGINCLSWDIVHDNYKLEIKINL